MKSASTPERTEEILFDVINGSRQHPVACVFYKDDFNQWIHLKDVRALSVSKNSINNDYNAFSLIPTVDSCSLEIDNKASKYSPGAGGEFDGVLVRDREIRVDLGYSLADSVAAVQAAPTGDYETLYHTKLNLGNIVLDPAFVGSPPALPGITTNLLGAALYGEALYSFDGAWISAPILAGESCPAHSLDALRVTANTTAIKVFARMAAHEDQLVLLPYTLLGSTVNGEATFPIGLERRYIQIVLLFQTGSWFGPELVSALNLDISTSAELIEAGIFLIDDISFAPALGNFSAKVAGRTVLKRAYESKISLPVYTNEPVENVLRDIVERLGLVVEENDVINGELVGELITLSMVGSDSPKGEKGQDVLNEIMVYINARSGRDYRLVVSDDAEFRLLILPETVALADYQYDYRYNILGGLAKSLTSKNTISRVTVFNNPPSLTPELGLGSQNVIHGAPMTTTGTINFTPPGIYKRARVDVNSGAFTAFSVTAMTATSLSFSITGTGDFDVVVLGNELSGVEFLGEAIKSANFGKRTGLEKDFTNRYLASQVEAQVVADRFVEIFGDQSFDFDLTIPMNPLQEINDKILALEPNTNSTDIMVVERITHNFTGNGANAKTQIGLRDFGFDLALDSLVYDRENYINSRTEEGDDDLIFDQGIVWDQDFPIGDTSDTASYDYLKPVEAI